MAEEKTIEIKPLVDIIWDGENRKKGSAPFKVPEKIANRLIKGKRAEEVK